MRAPCAGSLTARNRPKPSPRHGSPTSTAASCIWQHLEHPRPRPIPIQVPSDCPPCWTGGPGLDLCEHRRRPPSRFWTSNQPDISLPASLLYDRTSCWGPFWKFAFCLPNSPHELEIKLLSSRHLLFLFCHVSLAPYHRWVVSPGFNGVLSAVVIKATTCTY